MKTGETKTKARRAVAKGGGRKRKKSPPTESSKISTLKDRWSKQWLDKYNKLVSFQQIYGHCEIPQRFEEDPSLGRWVKKQREQYTYYTGKSNKQKTTLTKERVALLDKINFNWEMKVIKDFEVHMDELRQYKKTFGNCKVPHVYEKNRRLGVFVHRVKICRREMNEGKRQGPNNWLTQERIDALDELEFEWSPGRWKDVPSWEERYAQLLEFHDRHGHCRVSIEYEEEEAPGLRQWMSRQRSLLLSEKKTDTAMARTAEKKAALDSLGFEWSLKDDLQT